jgi:hypothetical protein
MLWMLLVYVVASNGFNAAPAVSPSFHGATFDTKEDCEVAARTVSLSTSPGVEDVAKATLLTVCAPVRPPPTEAKLAQPSVQTSTQYSSVQTSTQYPSVQTSTQYPSFPPPPKHNRY